MASVTLRNATDTWANGDATSTNYSDAKALKVRGTDRYAYLFFNRAAPRGSTIISAKLRVYHNGTWSGSRTLTAQRIAASWQASRLTWANRPGVTGTGNTVTDTGGPVGTLVEFNVTSLLQTVSDGAAWYGFRISTSDAASLGLVSSEGTSAYRPTLEVEWSEKPEAPTTLAPSGNRAVSVNKPLLRFDFTDTLGDTTLAAVQVQVDPASNWAAPGFDSGEVATSDPQLDLAATAYPGLAAGASTFWRVRVKDGAGLWSDWSASASESGEQFRYVALGTVTIANPSGATLSDPTPPFIWSFAGGTQKAWQVKVVDPASPSLTYADSGKQTGTDTAWTPPSKKLTGTGPYRVVIYVWDTVDREGIAGAPAYAQASRDFTIVPDVGVTGVTGLATSQPDEVKPRVKLTWTRASAPDSYVIRRDGTVIEDQLLPEDALVSGTSYEYVDDDARVWREHTWQVQARVNNNVSASSVVTDTPTQRGIWLLDKGRSLEVWIAGQESGSWAIGEEATVFAPVGGSNVVRRVQARRGYEGSLSGILVEKYGRTSASWEADLLKMRDEPTTPVTLALGDLSIRVILGNVTTYPLPTHVPPAHGVSFDFWQVQS